MGMLSSSLYDEQETEQPQMQHWMKHKNLSLIYLPNDNVNYVDWSMSGSLLDKRVMDWIRRSLSNGLLQRQLTGSSSANKSMGA